MQTFVCVCCCFFCFFVCVAAFFAFFVIFFRLFCSVCGDSVVQRTACLRFILPSSVPYSSQPSFVADVLVVHSSRFLAFCRLLVDFLA